MIIESNRTRCPQCLKPLAWKSHVKKWSKDGYIDEFTFQCTPCQREYMFKDDEVSELREERDPNAERIAIERLQVQEATANRLCPKCGSQLAHSPYSSWIVDLVQPLPSGVQARGWGTATKNRWRTAAETGHP